MNVNQYRTLALAELACEDVQIAPDAAVERVEGGAWVQARLWIAEPDEGLEVEQIVTLSTGALNDSDIAWLRAQAGDMIMVRTPGFVIHLYEEWDLSEQDEFSGLSMGTLGLLYGLHTRGFRWVQFHADGPELRVTGG